jgi:hypothetical protein
MLIVYGDDFLELIDVKAKTSHDLHSWYSAFLRHRRGTRKYGTIQHLLVYTLQ